MPCCSWFQVSEFCLQTRSVCLKSSSNLYVLTIPYGVTEEVITTASIVYKNHQRYGNAADKTTGTNKEKQVFQLNLDVVQKDFYRCSKSIRTNSDFKNNIRTLHNTTYLCLDLLPCS